MTDLLPSTFAGLPTETLENEKSRIETRIDELEHKRAIIVQVLAERALDETANVM